MVASGRQALKKEDEEVTYLNLGEEEEVKTMALDSGTMFELGEDSQAVATENQKLQDYCQKNIPQLTHLLEIRTKLTFVGNKVDLRNPDMVGQLADDIKTQQEQYGDSSKFLFCLHVGTTATKGIKDERPGFIEGRTKTLLDALNQYADELGVGSTASVSKTAFEHFQSTRFAGLVMKVYTGELKPGLTRMTSYRHLHELY